MIFFKILNEMHTMIRYNVALNGGWLVEIVRRDEKYL